jgi:glutamate formiminotransferase
MALVARYEADVKKIKDNVLRMVWHMRGGVSYTEAMNMSMKERDIIGKIVSDNMETTKKSGLPYF